MSTILNTGDFEQRAGDVVIIGAGLAGLFTALKLAPLAVTVIAAAPLGEGASSAWAQGGIAAAVGEGDSPEAHLADTMAAGAGIVDETIARITTDEAPERIADLLRYGVPFDRNLAGHFLLSREAAHRAKRIVRVKGDGAGRAIMQALIASVRNTPSIKVLEGFEAYALTKNARGRIDGVRLCPAGSTRPDEVFALSARTVVMATGGVGYLYALTTNPSYACGDAIAIAGAAGAVIADAEFVQFHPTAIDAGLDPAPLATEALRGEGATLVNNNGERFMTGQHADAELGPRDIVARGVFRELQAGRGAFLDCRGAIGGSFAKSYPTVYQRCIDAGIDPTLEPIPVAPAQHYHMGGIASDARGRTSLHGLWACGEGASTGLHGANRLASNSLLEAVVFGSRVAGDITLNVRGIGPEGIDPERVDITDLRRADRATTAPAVNLDHEAAVQELRQTMQQNVGVERDGALLRHAIKMIGKIEAAAKPARNIKLARMTLAARFIATAALRREESRGGHYRSDFPDAEPAFASRSFLTIADLDKVSSQQVTRSPTGQKVAKGATNA